VTKYNSKVGADLRLGLVGCGRLAARGYVPAIAKAPGLRLAAVADPVPDRCAHAAPGIPAFASAAELIAADAVDALVLATPAEAHVVDARLAARAGLLALIEKPPASTLAGAIQLAGLEPAPRFGFNRRFVPEIVSLRSGLSARCALEFQLEMRTRSASWGSFVADDDALLNLGPHLLDLARWLSGADIVGCRATVGASRATLELDLADGRGRARVLCASNRPYREQVLIRDRRGRKLGHYSAGGARAALALRLEGASANHPLVPSLVRQLHEFGLAVRGAAAPSLASTVDGVAVMAAIEAARGSAMDGGAWVPVESPVRSG
jgi:myo-inositol 2-dehydrogenase/D-chiro-inositol 1-dehydrogenase